MAAHRGAGGGEKYTRHDLRTGFQRKISCKPLTEKEAEIKRLTMTKIMQCQCKVDCEHANSD